MFGADLGNAIGPQEISGPGATVKIIPVFFRVGPRS